MVPGFWQRRRQSQPRSLNLSYCDQFKDSMLDGMPHTARQVQTEPLLADIV